MLGLNKVDVRECSQPLRGLEIAGVSQKTETDKIGSEVSICSSFLIMAIST